MKINYKNTALGILDNPEGFRFYVPEESVPQMNDIEAQEFMRSVVSAFKDNDGLRKQFKKKVQFITRPFYEAYRKSEAKLKAIVMKEQHEDAGTLIIPWPNHTQTIFYFVYSNGQPEDWSYKVMLIVFTKSPHCESFGLDLFVSIDETKKEFKEFIWKGFVDQGRDSTWWIADLLLFKTFLKYAEAETKVVNREKKEHHCGEKYLNETKRSIEILDSNYFTTISRTEGFGVRGHFRWQHYGPGMTNKKLQWISDFQKHGYTRKAKILR